jgi:F-box interacting protein
LPKSTFTCQPRATISLAKHDYIFNVFTLPPVFTKKVTPTTMHKLNRKNQRVNGLIGSCHGILCFQLGQAPLLLWNPSFQNFTNSPSLKIIPDGEGWMSTTTNYGFGYDHSTDTYKVIAFACTEYNTGVYKVQTHVHAMGTNFWKRIRADFPGVPKREPGKFVSGTINCLVKDSKQVIVSLDFETESYRRLLLPVVTSTFCVLQDCLSIVFNSKTFSDVWLMKEYGNQDSWTKLFHVPYKGDVGCGNYTMALYVYDNDRVLLDYFRKLVVYNSRDGTFKTLRIQQYGDWMIPEVFQESLISPCS